MVAMASDSYGFGYQSRRTAIIALVWSIVAGVIALVFFAVMVFKGLAAYDSGAYQPQYGGTPLPSSTESGLDDPAEVDGGPEPLGGSSGTDAAETVAGTEADGSFSNPFPIGTEFQTPEWTVAITDVDLDATENIEILSFPDGGPSADADGNVYVQVSFSVTYTGTDPNGAIPWATVAYVTADGTTYGLDGAGSYLMGPDPMTPLLPGVSTPNTVFIEVPADGVEQGVIALSPDSAMDIFFVAVR